MQGITVPNWPMQQEETTFHLGNVVKLKRQMQPRQKVEMSLCHLATGPCRSLNPQCLQGYRIPNFKIRG